MIYLLFWIHWIADFILQTDKMALNKSRSWKWLSAHIAVYTACLLPLGFAFAVVNGLAHFVTDAITSRLTSYLYQKGDRHNFFVVIGLDQASHLTVLIATMPLMEPIWTAW